jgi:hypothetical protein
MESMTEHFSVGQLTAHRFLEPGVLLVEAALEIERVHFALSDLERDIGIERAGADEIADAEDSEADHQQPEKAFDQPAVFYSFAHLVEHGGPN